MAFWQFTGVSPEFFPTLGFTAQPNEVYDLGNDSPPYSQLAAGSVAGGLPVLKWTSASGPATRRITSRTDEAPAAFGPRSYFGAEDQGFINWAFDPAVMAGSSIPTAGTLTMTRIPILRPVTISTVHMYVVTAGATLTANQCFLALYRVSDRALLSATAEQSANWQSAGLKSVALTTPQAVTGDVYVAHYWNGTTGPSFARGVATPLATLINNNVIRFGQANTGLTTAMPGTASAPTANGSSFWVGVS